MKKMNSTSVQRSIRGGTILRICALAVSMMMLISGCAVISLGGGELSSGAFENSSKTQTSKYESSKPQSSAPESSNPQSSKEESSKEESSKDESSAEESSKDESSVDESSKDESSRDESSRDESSKDESSKDESSKDESSKEESSKTDAKEEDPNALPAEINPVQKKYEILSDDLYYLDIYGNPMPNDGIIRGYLYDMISGKEAYAYCKKMIEKEGRMYTYTRLYSLDDVLLIDWTTDKFYDGVNGYVIREKAWDFLSSQDEHISDLIDPWDDSVIYEGIRYMYPLDDDTVVVLDVNYYVLGGLNAAGEIKFGYPMQKPYYLIEAIEGYFMVSNGDASDGNTSVILNNMGQVTAVNGGLPMLLSLYSMVGDYYQLQDEGENIIYSLETNEEVFRSTDSIEYFDGEMVILRRKVNDEWMQILCDIEGNELSEPCRQILVAGVDIEGLIHHKSDVFYLNDGASIRMINRDGEILNEWSETNLFSTYMENENILFLVMDGELYAWGMLDADMNPIVPAEKYNYITLLYEDMENPQNQLWSAAAFTDKGGSYTILDSAGNVIRDNVTTVGTCDEQAIAVICDGWIGIIDHSGNWICANEFVPHETKS